ncbi:U3 small nucleolar RNA-associated protein 18 homolog isoform X2 [Cololabis saira]|uniref:U3 small nucleolar RNA-associated protein 18 homolog isoform X2 n=1 Tax=Cololabis saira TaxID=129043 RepID=UPI002AD3C38C|nr:U3 small nucleolar RNA-associated protein 18 homolog isoform X2 [Cololabis saira]
MEDVIKLPDEKPTEPRKKKARKVKMDPETEVQKRQKNAEQLAVLGEEDGSVRRLESLVFGAEDELLERLVEEEEEEQTGALLLLEDDGSDESEAEAEARQQPRKPAWVDEDDEQEEQVDMTHRYRRNLMKGEAEASMSKQKLQQRMREQ